MKTIISCLVLLICSTYSYAQLASQHVQLSLGEQKIQGTLTCPPVNEKVPLVIIVSGSGPSDRDGNSPMTKNNSLSMLADALLQYNIASLRYDKRGVATSKALVNNEANLRFEHYVEDLSAWVAKYKVDERFSELILCGHSEGALVALLVAQQGEVAKYISLEGAALPAADIIRSQLAAQPAVLSMAEPILTQLEQGKTYPHAPAMLNSLFRPSVQPYLISWFRYNPALELKQLNIPILLVQGSTDLQTKVQDFDLLTAGNAEAQQHLVEGMNHILKKAPIEVSANMATYSQANLPLHPDLMATIIAFIKAKN